MHVCQCIDIKTGFLNINQVFLYTFIMSWFLDRDCFNHKTECTKHMSLRLSNTFQSQLPLCSPVIACHFLCQIMTVDIQFVLCVCLCVWDSRQFRWSGKHLAFQKAHTHINVLTGRVGERIRKSFSAELGWEALLMRPVSIVLQQSFISNHPHAVVSYLSLFPRPVASSTLFHTVLIQTLLLWRLPEQWPWESKTIWRKDVRVCVCIRTNTKTAKMLWEQTVRSRRKASGLRLIDCRHCFSWN